MQQDFSHNISGADKFQLLLDRHIRINEQCGNVIRLSIELGGRIDAAQLRQSIESNSFLSGINSLTIKQGFLSIPQWKKGIVHNTIALTEHFVTTDTFIPPGILSRDINLNSGHLLHVDLVQGPGCSTLVISAHHILADNQGIQWIAKCIAGTIMPTGDPFSKAENDKTSFISKLTQTFKATLFVFKKSPKKLAKISHYPIPSSSKEIAGFSVLRFTELETKQIEDNALKNGARLSKSSFYLAATAMALRQTIFAGKGDCFFLPVPQNQRLRGNDQICLGNSLSFLFYSIPFNKLDKLNEASEFITLQMMEQVKEQMPKSYSHLLQTFRFLPLAVYDFFFKLPTKGAICSFLFSDVGETLADMKTFWDLPVTEVLNFPPNPSPPYLTFVLMKHDGALKLVTAYNPSAIPEAEITKFETMFSALLKQ